MAAGVIEGDFFRILWRVEGSSEVGMGEIIMSWTILLV